MTQQQEENKMMAKMRECHKEVEAVLEKYDAQLIARTILDNGQLDHHQIVVAPKPPRVIIPSAVMGDPNKRQ